MNSPEESAFGVYVHWPFCARKCPYCDFNSHVRSEAIDEARYLAAFQREIAHAAALTGPRTVTSIFLGGGTPSLMAPKTVAGVLESVENAWALDDGAEITLEANPGSVEASRFRGYRAAGVNRVSLGVQSLRDGDLRKLGRVHDVSEAKGAIEIARRTFDRFSFDLIYARENQTLEDWRAELGEALALAHGHLSLYQLTIEPETPFARWHAAGKLTIPDDDEARDLYELTQEMTERAGLPAYEISNHARPGEESRHNLLYWRYGEYAGVGPGAHGRLILNPEGHGTPRRRATVAERYPERWLELVETNGRGVVEVAPLSPAEQTDEMLLMGLRLSGGLDLDHLARLGGLRPRAEVLATLVELGLLDWDSGHARIRATSEGRLVLNDVAARLSAGLASAPAAARERARV